MCILATPLLKPKLFHEGCWCIVGFIPSALEPIHSRFDVSHLQEAAKELTCRKNVSRSNL